MDNPYLWPLTLLVFLPALASLVLLLLPRDSHELIKRVSLFVTILVFFATVVMALPGITGGPHFSLAEDAVAEMQSVFQVSWIPAFNIQYFMGIDGISFPLLVLTAFVGMLAMGASWPITKHVKAYCVLFLLLETGMLGVFLALDFFLFYVFWEVMLLPMYFLIGVWGGPRREYAAIKFFLYTPLGRVLMLIATLLLYFNSDLRTLSDEQLITAHVVPDQESAKAWRVENPSTAEVPRHTFNILALQQLGQHTDQFSKSVFTEGGKSIQWWAFILLFIGFVIKVPSVPVHTWLPDAHVEAPTPISMILAGVLLKMGGYGIIRICYPIVKYGLRSFRRTCTARFQADGGLQFGESHGICRSGAWRLERGGTIFQWGLLEDGDEWRHVSDDCARNQFCRHVLSSGCYLRQSTPS